MKRDHLSLVLSATFACTAIGAVRPAAASETADGGAPTAPREPLQSRFGFDLEADPTAFVLGGYSLHAGLGWRGLRLDIGGYGMNVPELMHGNAGFDASFRGVGAKLQWFPFAERRGAFIGVDAGVAWLRVEPEGSDLSATQTQLGVGVNGGYRIDLPYGLYVTPWLGIGYTMNNRDLHVGERTFESSPISFFPAVHVGYRFD
jgi:hypothetical protein